MKKRFTFLLVWVSLISINHLFGQVAKTQVVRLSAVANTDGTLTLQWPKENYAGVFKIYRRPNPLFEDWGAMLAQVPGNQNTYVDAKAKKGIAYEYLVVKSNGSTNEALGYLYSGNEYDSPFNEDGILLVVDSSLTDSLSFELDRYKSILSQEGYRVSQILAGRSESTQVIRDRIIAARSQLNPKPVVLVLIGKIPVPYSGYYSSTGDAPPPDGHVEGSGNHTGAWPADVYYAIHEEDAFTDKWVNITTGNQNRHHNIPSDGKWDQTKLPYAPVMEVGRIDLSNMPAFGKTEVQLLKDYFNRNYLWRTGKWKVTERALIDNNFTGLNLASTGYANFSALILSDSIFDNRDYFTAQKNGSYLWSYGCGAGSYTSCSGIGNTNNFANDSFENVFTILAGSYFGDYDVQNNFLRAPLASSSLASFWGGIPKWYVHYMGLGERIGKGIPVTQFNEGFYFTGNFNAAQRSMHIAFMGDPTLKQYNHAPITQLNANSVNGKVILWWPKTQQGATYALYRNKQLLAKGIMDTFFIDEHNYYTGEYTYHVFEANLQTTPSGTFMSKGAGAMKQISHTNGLTSVNGLSPDLKVYPNPAQANQTLNLQMNLPLNHAATYQWFDLIGNSIGQEKTMGVSNTIATPIVPEGIYLLKLTNNNQTLFTRVLIY